MGHGVGNGNCPIWGRLEDHKHLFRHCMFGPFYFDTVRKAFGVIPKEGGGGDRISHRLLEELAESLQCT